MKVALYARVSTGEQSTDNQIPVLERWARDRYFEVIACYIESESAWKAGHQKELARSVAGRLPQRQSKV